MESADVFKIQTDQKENLGFAQNGSSILDSNYKLPVGNDPQKFSLYSDREGILGGSVRGETVEERPGCLVEQAKHW